MNKKIIIGIVFGLVILLVYSPITTCGIQTNIKNITSLTVTDVGALGADLVGYWNFDEGNGNIAHDGSGNGNDGTIYGGASWTSGVSGGALEFDGIDDYVDCGNDTSLDITGEITIAAWIKPLSFDESWKVVSKKQSYYLDFVTRARFYLFGLYGEASLDLESNPFEANEWYHYVGTYDGSVMKMFIDGDEVASMTISGTISVTDNDLLFGSYDGNIHMFDGSIDEIYIYKRALSESEIQDLMGNLPPNTPTINGLTSGKAGIEYEYTFNAEDPNGDDVKYHIDWGDGNTETTAFSPSGTDMQAKHTWSTKGTYTIRAKAEDIHGAESPWSELRVTMPKNKESTDSDDDSNPVGGFTPESDNNLFSTILRKLFAPRTTTTTFGSNLINAIITGLLNLR